MARPSSRRGKLRRRPMSQINVVPYIDVMLVLLVIFMITQPLLTQGVQVELPQAASQSVNVDAAKTLVVKVDVQGNLFLTIGSEPEFAVTEQHLVKRVNKQLQKSPDSSIMIAGDKQVPYEHVMKALALLKNAGVANVGLMTKPLDET